MPDYVTQPLQGAAAFLETTRSAQLAQAAQLLVLGSQIRGDEEAFRAKSDARGFTSEFFFPDVVTELGIPRIPYQGKRFDRQERTPLQPRELPLTSEEAAATRQRILQSARQFHASPSPSTTAQLLEASLRSPYAIVRVAAASSYFDLTTDPTGLVEILVEGTQSNDPLVRKVAANALAHIEPGHQRLKDLITETHSDGPLGPLHTSVLVHGTWASTESWWQPGGDFHTYVLNDVWKDLYNSPDRFKWSGGYSDAARSLAGADLSAWLVSHQASGANLMTHSHGGSVAMLTSHTAGISMNELVLLSCPVHVPKYVPNFEAMGKVVSVRVKMDLVILADRGGQRFNLPQIQENILPIWFDHSATHDVAVWKQHNVPAML